MILLGDVHAVDYGIRQLLKCQAAIISLKRDPVIRGGMSPNFLAQAKSVEPRWARARQNSPQALFECENFTNKLKNASSGLLGNLGSRSLQSLAYLLPAKNLDEAIESKPKLTPPLPAIGNWSSVALKLPMANMRFWVILENLNKDNQNFFCTFSSLLKWQGCSQRLNSDGITVKDSKPHMAPHAWFSFIVSAKPRLRLPS